MNSVSKELTIKCPFDKERENNKILTCLVSQILLVLIEILFSLIFYCMGFDLTLISRKTCNHNLFLLLTNHKKNNNNVTTNQKTLTQSKTTSNIVTLVPNKICSIVHKQGDQKKQQLKINRSLKFFKKQQSGVRNVIERNTSLSQRVTKYKNIANQFRISRKKDDTQNQKEQINFKNGKINHIITQNVNSKQKIYEQILSNKQKNSANRNNKYTIDYSSFNFLDKVKNNPEKWLHFVHKNIPKNTC